MLALGKVSAVMLALLLAAGCDNQSQTKTADATAKPPTAGNETQPPPSSLPPIEEGKELPYVAVYTVNSVDVAVLERNPAALEIRVKGTARTGGWTEVHLNQLSPPQIGMGEVGFTLVASAPEGPATQALTPVETTFVLDPLPPDVKRVRVFAETNEVSVDIQR